MNFKHETLELTERIKKHYFYRILESFMGFFLLIAFYFAYFPISFSPPDLTVKHELLSLLTDSNTNSTTAARSDLLIVNLYNNSNEAISNVELNISGFKKINKIFVSSNSSRITSEYEQIISYTRLKSGLIFFPNLRVIPPKTNISLEVWGKITHVFPGHRIVIKSSATKTEIQESKHIYGSAIFLVNNLIPISVFIAFIVFLVGAKKFSKSKP
ncbi:MAG: hypothetical protein N0E58_20375 [Candidatus Thiodiazotropha endolucinida]|uniref:Uncharacterized protein n=1 Tax=Candidatus Thiodiazotropha taylori TaxID=2792791 RepID=A0A9E4TUL2_9GAMM|nr:hypothetical protein [Candidatus Thiodiazotropha taylori]MCG7980470.1 hypothetical protein [Candidatus Thiodiazotropha taylori]MCW4238609.1 hypothetical protein [Candidatus Thiodiazotropha endolucinida]